MLSSSMLTLAIAKRIVQKQETPAQVSVSQMQKYAAALGYSASVKDDKVVCTVGKHKTSVSVEAVRRQANVLARAAGSSPR